MQLSTILTKLAAGTVAGLLTMGTGWAFAEVVGEEPPAEAPAEDPVVDPVTDPVEDPVTDPVEDPVEDPVTDPVEDPVEDPVTDPVEDPVEDPVADPVEEPVTDPVTDPVVDEDPPEEEPVEHVRKENHGKHVSEAAHTAPKGPGHGAAVSEVAKSDVGKKHAGEETTATVSSTGHGKK